MQYPSQREQEILDLIQEECAEVIAIISKIRRFGYPCNWKGGDTNIISLMKELQDVEILTKEIRQCLFLKVCAEYNAQDYKAEKIERLKKFTGIYSGDIHPIE
ncbi:hypothetical protein [Synechococcus phage BUCT-ZZ01]|nr:hypothetical protein [Synechococcus phage BUCT-ZZ01]